jgi:hypothetical protein
VIARRRVQGDIGGKGNFEVGRKELVNVISGNSLALLSRGCQEGIKKLIVGTMGEEGHVVWKVGGVDPLLLLVAAVRCCCY